MTKQCIRPDVDAWYCYKKFACRCSRCTAANSEACRQLRNQYPERRKEQQAKYYEKERERAETDPLYNLTRRIKTIRTTSRRLDYAEPNFTAEQLLPSFLAGPTCDICSDDTRMCIDHCHTTGDFRGWLCHRCNAAVGYFRDCVDRMKAGIEYLQRPREDGLPAVYADSLGGTGLHAPPESDQSSKVA